MPVAAILRWTVPLAAALAVLSQQQDFWEQKGQLQEEVEAANHLIIFYPMFHCELNFIERFWCGELRALI